VFAQHKVLKKMYRLKIKKIKFHFIYDIGEKIWNFVCLAGGGGLRPPAPPSCLLIKRFWWGGLEKIHLAG
jgi:hypothetical protein